MCILYRLFYIVPLFIYVVLCFTNPASRLHNKCLSCLGHTRVQMYGHVFYRYHGWSAEYHHLSQLSTLLPHQHINHTQQRIYTATATHEDRGYFDTLTVNEPNLTPIISYAHISTVLGFAMGSSNMAIKSVGVRLALLSHTPLPAVSSQRERDNNGRNILV